MGKQGPCYHCGVTSTPLWRNGPPEKPVLCNACGSRWRTKGTLANYAPLHSRHDSDEYNDRRLSRPKTLSLKIGEQNLKKRKFSFENYNRSCLESIDEEEEEDAINISSYGSAMSNTELQFSGADDRDFTGPEELTVWKSQVPSKKRSVLNHTNSSPVHKFIKDLHAILHEQQQSSYHCEEDLLFEDDVPMVSVEIGHGSMLITHPTSFASEEESESSSVSFENKLCAVNEVYSYNGSQRDQFKNDSMQHLLTHNLPLCCIDLCDSKSPKQTTKRPLQQQILNIPGKETNENHKRDLIKRGLRSNFCDQDLLLDVPSNCCFPEAELLLPPSIHSAMIHH